MGSGLGQCPFAVIFISWEFRCSLAKTHFLSADSAHQRLLLRPRSMATMTEPRNLEFKVPPTQPVILMSLNPSENDYLFLSIISFFFFILLAIPALFFSLKVSTIWLTPTPTVPRYAYSVPPRPPIPPQGPLRVLPGEFTPSSTI